MKKGTNVFVFFLGASCLALVFLLMINLHRDLLRLAAYAMVGGLLATITYVLFRRQVVRFYYTTFNKDYKYGMKHYKKNNKTR